MPSNHTPNYQLSQWERTDKILMDDFNADNAKIDAALAALAFRLPVELARVKLTGTAKKITFNLSGIDRSRWPRLRVICPHLCITEGKAGIQVNGLASGYLERNATSLSGSTGVKYAAVAWNGTASSTTDIFPLGEGIAFYTDSVAVSGSSLLPFWIWSFLRNFSYTDMTSLEIMCDKEEAYFEVGSEAVLYGLRE